MSYSDDQLRGVGGWLGFLCVSLIGLGPLASLVRTWADLNESEQQYPILAENATWAIAKMVVWVLVLIQAGLMIYTGLRLNSSTKRKTIRFAKIMLWISNPIMNLVSALAVGFLFSTNPFEEKDIIVSLGRGVVWATVWTLYLSYSRRVQNTYTDEDEDVGDVRAVFE